MNQSGFHGRNVTGTARHCGLELPKWIVWVPIFPGKSVFSLLRLSDTFKDDILVGLGFFVVWVVVFCFKIVCSGNDPILRSMFFRWVVSSPPRCFFRANPFKSHEMSCLSPITSYEIKSPSESGNKCLYINLFQPFLF